MSNVQLVPRRRFLQTTAVATAGLVIGFRLPLAGEAAEARGEFAPNAFLRIGPDGRVTVIVGKSEMGQGVYTALPMIVAEELDADWSQVSVESAPVAPEYNHTAFGIQMTGGSTSVWSSYDQLRQAGAMARAMLVAAAAAAWGVEPASCRTEKSFVIHEATKQRLSYGSLAEAASRLSLPLEVALKDPKDFRLIGKPTRRLDTPEKTNGQAVFGIDVKLPDLLTAVIARPPVFGAKVRSVNSDRALAIPGVKGVHQVDSGVAVVAEGFWPAKRGRDALRIEWDEGPWADFSTVKQREQYVELARKPGLVARNDGDAASALASATKKIEAEYEVPYLAHATMEPLNCVVDLRDDGCEIWTGTQFQTMDRAAAAAAAGLKPEQVQIRTTLLGGGFGRRANPVSDFVVEAVQVAKAVKAPVKVVWTREDDTRGGYYRPFWYDRIAAGLDASGAPVAWTHTVVGQSIMAGTAFESFIQDGIDGSSVEGAADLPYAIPNLRVELHSPKLGVPVLWWRSVGHSHTAFVVESFLDELAHAAGKDPVEMRRALLAEHPRHRGVLELAAEKAGWGKPLPAGRGPSTSLRTGRGIAVHESFGSFIAQVAEVSVSKTGGLRVERVVCAIDCGQVVNPDTIQAQMESGIIFGLTAALKGEITFKQGRAQQRNFHDYQMLRIDETPEIEVHIVPSTEKHGGVGEPGVPPIAPAVANAIFAATGKRLRRLPIRAEDLS
jgi:isoquinoline 1-oxidoreductase beta subunit